MEINSSTIVTILIVIAILVIGIVTVGYIEEVFPDAVPSYDETFPVGSAPFEYDTTRTDLTSLTVSQYLSTGVWVTVSSANYTYADGVVTIDAGALYV